MTLRAGRSSLTFDFWASQDDTTHRRPLRAYTVLSSLAADVGYGEMTPDDVAADLAVPPSQARAAVAFGRRVSRFFEPIGALADLARIQ